MGQDIQVLRIFFSENNNCSLSVTDLQYQRLRNDILHDPLIFIVMVSVE